MAKPRKEEPVSSPKKQVQNSQRPIWVSFDQCWASCVKNGTPLLKEAAIAHIKSLGMWEDQSRWVDALIHFGIPIEK